MFLEIKQFLKENEADITLVIGVILISLISFGGGWLLGTSLVPPAFEEQIKIEELPLEELKASPTKLETSDQQQEITNQPQEEQKPSTEESQSKFVASKNSDVYHYPWCPGAQRIKEENKVYFSSKEEAEKAGYRPAKNCPGL